MTDVRDKRAPKKLDYSDLEALEKAFQDELTDLAYSSLTIRKKQLAREYRVSEADIVRCWKSINEKDNEHAESEQVRKTKERMTRSVEPWQRSVRIDELFSEVKTVLKQLVVFRDENQAMALSAWLMATWFYDYVNYAPYILITSPVGQCGKSTLIENMAKLARNPFTASSISPAAFFRLMEQYHPTILLDEVDSFLKDKQDLQGILKCGIRRNDAFVWRTVLERNGNYEPCSYDCFGFKGFSGIRITGISDPITDRSIVIELSRRRKEEKIIRARDISDEIWSTLPRKCLKAALQYGPLVQKARPSLPEELSDRDCDKWEPLFAIIDAANKPMLSAAIRRCALKLSKRDTSESSIPLELLKNVYEIVQVKIREGMPFILTRDLLASLNTNSDYRWSTFNGGRAFEAKQLASHLEAFGVKPKPIRSKNNSRGYIISELVEVFERYLSSETIAQA